MLRVDYEGIEPSGADLQSLAGQPVVARLTTREAADRPSKAGQPSLGLLTSRNRNRSLYGGTTMRTMVRVLSTLITASTTVIRITSSVLLIGGSRCYG